MTRTFFTDRDLGKTFPEILQGAGLKVERFDDHFGPATADVPWLRSIGERGWIALSRDSRIRYNPAERDAVMENGVSLLLIIGTAPHAALARSEVAYWGFTPPLT